MPDDKFWRAIPTWALDRQRADDEADSWAAQKRSDIADQWAKLMRQDTAARLAEMGYFPDGRHIDDIPPKTFESDLAEPSIAPKAMGLEAPGAEVAPQDRDGMDWQVPDIPPPAGVLGGMGRLLPPPPLSLAKKPPPSQQEHERALAGEAPLQTPQDYVGEASRLASSQLSTSPGAIGGFGASEEAQAAAFRQGLTEGGGAGRGLGAAAVHAAGDVPTGGGGLLDAMGRPIRRVGDEVAQIVGPREEVISTVAPEVPGAAVIRTNEAGQPTPEAIARLTPNLKYLGPDVHASIIRTVQENPDEFARFQRGTISLDETIEAASRLGITADEFKKLAPGRGLNEYEQLALRAAAVKTTDRAQNLALLIDQMGGIKNASPEDKKALISSMLDAGALAARALGGASTAGRTLRQQQQLVTSRLAAGITNANEEIAKLREYRTLARQTSREERRALAEQGITALREDGQAAEADALQGLFDALGSRLGKQVEQEEKGLAHTAERLGLVPERIDAAYEAAFAKLDAAVNKRAARSEQARIYRDYQKGMAAWRKEQRGFDAEDKAYEKMINFLEAQEGRANVKRYQMTEKLLGRASGKEISDDMIENFIEVTKTGDPYAAAAFVRGLENPSWYGRIQLLRYAGLLSATTTQALNAVSSGIGAGMHVGMRPASAMVDTLASQAARLIGRDYERTRYAAESKPMLIGFKDGFLAGLKDAPRVFRTGLSPASVTELEHLPATLASGYPRVDTVLESPLRFLTTVDHVWQSAARGASYAALAERQAIREGLKGEERAARASYVRLHPEDFPELFEQANSEAQRAIFREKRGEMQSIGRALSQHAPIVKDNLFPFLRTPYNVAAQAAGMTPAGYFAALRSARRGDTGEAVDRATRATAGVFVMGLGGIMGYNGMATTGLPPQNDPERYTQPQGRVPWAIRVPLGDEKAMDVEFKNLGPAAFPFAIGATIGDAARRGERFSVSGDMINRVGLAFLSYLKDQPWLQGMALVGDFFESPSRTFGQASENIARTYMPASGIQRQVDQAILGNPAREYEGPVEAWMSASPLTNQGLPVKQDRLGKPVRRENDALGWALSFIARTGIETDSPILRAFREAGIGLPSRPKERSLGGEKPIELTRDEQRSFERGAGAYIEEEVADAMAQPDWPTYSPEEKRQRLRKAVEHARKRAGEDMVSTLSDDDLMRRIEELRTKKGAVTP